MKELKSENSEKSCKKDNVVLDCLKSQISKNFDPEIKRACYGIYF